MGKEEKSERLRKRAVRELLETEETYVQTLILVIVNYRVPLANPKNTFLTKEQYDTLFPKSLAKVLEYNKKFLEDLKKRVASWSKTTTQDQKKIGDIILDFCPYLSKYEDYYVTNQNDINPLLTELMKNEPFNRYCNDKRAFCNNLNLEALLITPIQRAPRYVLLVKEILKHTPVDHIDHVPLKQALARVKKVNVEINKALDVAAKKKTVKQLEARLGGKIQLSDKELIHKGEFYKVGRKQDILYKFYLFSNQLIYCSQKGNSYKLHNTLPVDGAFWVEPTDEKDNAFKVHSSNKSFVGYTATSSLRDTWMRAFETAMMNFMNQKRSVRTGIRRPVRKRSVPIMSPHSTSSHCTIESCRKRFSYFNTKKNCRICGKLVCKTCLRYSMPNPTDPAQLVKACTECAGENDDDVRSFTLSPSPVRKDPAHRRAYSTSASPARSFMRSLSSTYLLYPERIKRKKRPEPRTPPRKLPRIASREPRIDSTPPEGYSPPDYGEVKFYDAHEERIPKPAPIEKDPKISSESPPRLPPKPGPRDIGRNYDFEPAVYDTEKSSYGSNDYIPTYTGGPRNEQKPRKKKKRSPVKRMPESSEWVSSERDIPSEAWDRSESRDPNHLRTRRHVRSRTHASRSRQRQRSEPATDFGGGIVPSSRSLSRENRGDPTICEKYRERSPIPRRKKRSPVPRLKVVLPERGRAAVTFDLVEFAF